MRRRSRLSRSWCGRSQPCGKLTSSGARSPQLLTVSCTKPANTDDLIMGLSITPKLPWTFMARADSQHGLILASWAPSDMLLHPCGGETCLIMASKYCTPQHLLPAVRLNCGMVHLAPLWQRLQSVRCATAGALQQPSCSSTAAAEEHHR